MDITARKRAVCVAALWIALPAVLGASLNPSNDSPPVDVDTRISSYMRGSPPRAPEKSAKSVQTGLASYYSKRFDGKKTASGETFSNTELVAAHRTLPLGTRVRVTNLENDETVELRITDRGASAKNHQEGVIIDVSQAAATRLKMKKDGRVKVRVEVLEWGEDRKAARGS